MRQDSYKKAEKSEDIGTPRKILGEKNALPDDCYLETEAEEVGPALETHTHITTSEVAKDLEITKPI